MNSMNSNHKICITAQSAIIECIALLNALRCYTNGICWFVLRPAQGKRLFLPATWLVGMEKLSRT